MKPLLETILSRELHDPKAIIYKWLDEHEIKNYTLNNKGEIDVDGDVDLGDYNLTEFPPFIQFGVVKGHFGCNNNNLTTLKGAPKKIGGGFYCYNNKLTSLEGAPREVEKDFYCSTNKLTSLEGAPEAVGGGFYCGFNLLKTLEGAPERVGEYFDCSYNSTKFTEDDVRKVCKVKKGIIVK